MRVLFVTAELAPFAKVGGLADVAAGLPSALHQLGLDVRVIVPLYATIVAWQHDLKRLPVSFTVPGEAGQPLLCELWEGRLGELEVYFVEEARYLAREQVYGAADDLDRFTCFSRAVLASARALDFQPDVLHVNDWHSAILPAWLSLGLVDDGYFDHVASLLSIHNLAFQGWFDDDFRRRWALVCPDVADDSVAGVSLTSTLALGINYADLINTVSPTYAREILTPEFGNGLDPLLRVRQDRLFGVLNGIDVAAFDPRTDPQISPNYGQDSLERKAQVKAALQRESGLSPRPEPPLIGVVGRLAEQKGLDLVLAAVQELLPKQPFQLVVLGTGELRFQQLFSNLARQHPEVVAVFLKFDAALAQRIYAGADLFLMPSRFEPCGLGQLIALRYGTVPLVRDTGGLRDTIRDWHESRASGNGFVFQDYTVDALVATLTRALQTFKDPPSWREIQQNGMRSDNSWGRSAQRYLELYDRACSLRAGSH
jgi:starch synthase